MLGKQRKFSTAEIQKAGKTVGLSSSDVEYLLSILLKNGRKNLFPRLKKKA